MHRVLLKQIWPGFAYSKKTFGDSGNGLATYKNKKILNLFLEDEQLKHFKTALRSSTFVKSEILILLSRNPLCLF